MTNGMKKAVALVLCFVTVFALCACGSKEEISKKKFEATAEKLGLTVSLPPVTPIGVKEVSIIGKASGYDFVWQAEYYLLGSEEDARSVFEQNKAVFQDVSGTELSTALPSHATYEKTGGGQYIYLSQVGKTFVYVVVDEQYKSEAKAFISEIGY